MKIILLRHGKPAIDLNGRLRDKVSGFDIQKIVEDYYWVGLAEKQDIPDEVRTVSAQCGICVTSDMERSIESAKLLLTNNIMKSDSIYREAAMPYPLWRNPKMSLKCWFYLLRGLWLFGYKQNGDSISEARHNAKIGAEQLIAYAKTHDTVLLVGHGINIRLIAKQLQAFGWSGSSAWTREYWGFNQFILE